MVHLLPADLQLDGIILLDVDVLTLDDRPDIGIKQGADRSSDCFRSHEDVL